MDIRKHRSLLELTRLVAACVLAQCMLPISDAVQITPVTKPIIAKDTDGVVTLPCDFTTDTYETPQITWYKEGEERRRVMMFDIRNRLTSYGEFLNRVARGDGGALVLLRPTARDSGNYSCEIEVDKEIPAWVKGTVRLRVATSEGGLTESPSQQSGILSLVFICISWLAASGCGFLFGKQWTRRTVPGRRPRQTKFPIQRFRVAVGTGFVLGMCLTFAGTVLTAYSLFGLKSSFNMLYIKLGLGIGSTGVVSVIIMTVLGTRVPLEDNDNGKKQDDRNQPLYEEMPLVKVSIPVAGQPGVKTLQCTQPLAIPGTDQLAVQTLQYPPDTKFAGMVSTSEKDVYLSTTSTEKSSTKTVTKSGLFHMDTTIGSQWAELSDRWDGNPTFLMVAKYKQGVVICSKVFSSGFFNDSYKYQLIQKPKVNNAGKIVGIKTAISWVREGVNDDSLYVCDTEHGVVAKVNASGKRLFEFGKDVLKTPTCFAQNSQRCFIVADSGKPDLLVFNRNGSFETSMKISVPKSVEEGLEGCNSLDIGPDDKIYASGPLSNNVFVFSADFRFEGLLSTQSPMKEGILSLMVHNQSLYVAHEDCIRIYPLSLTESAPSHLYNQSTVYCSTSSALT